MKGKNDHSLKKIGTVCALFLLAGGIVLLGMPVNAPAPIGCIDVTKTCNDASGTGQPITFSGTVTNCSTSSTLTNVTVVDDHAGVVLSGVTLAAGASADYSGSYIPATSPSTNTVTASGTAGIYTYRDTASDTCNILGDKCWLTAGGVKFVPYDGGVMAAQYNGPKDNVGGNVYPGCSPDAGDGGSWTHIAHHEKLHFHGTDITVLQCGNVPGIEPGSESPVTPYNYIEFEGTGTLSGIMGNKADYATVCFFARAEDRNEPGNENANGSNGGAYIDRYYMEVYDCSTGDLLLLVDDNYGNPRTITGGNFQLHFQPCPNK